MSTAFASSGRLDVDAVIADDACARTKEKGKACNAQREAEKRAALPLHKLRHSAFLDAHFWIMPYWSVIVGESMSAAAI